MGWKSVIGIILLGLLMKRAWDMSLFLQPWKVVYNHAPGPCHLVSPLANGSEDMQDLPNGKIIISSGLKLPAMAQNPRIMNSLGQFYIFDFNSPGDGAKVVPCNNFPDYGTKNFAPHGISVLDYGGEVFLFAVNHPPKGYFEKDTVEKFKYDSKTNNLHHLKTYSGDYFRMINDVVAIGPESFFVTNWIYNRNKILSQFEFLVFNLHWSSLLYYNDGKVQTVADNFLMANGVNISPDKRHVYIATMNNPGIKVFERNHDGSLTFVQSKILPTTACDNIHVDRDTGDLWVACHPCPIKTLSYMEEIDEHRPLAPSQVLRINTKDGLLTEVTEVYSNDGSAFNMSSVAVYDRITSAMLVGSVEGNLLYCKVHTL